MLHFLLLGNTQTRHRNSIWFGNETALVHFPMQTDQSSIASTHGGFSGKAQRKSTWKSVAFFHLERLTLCNLFNMTLRIFFDLDLTSFDIFFFSTDGSLLLVKCDTRVRACVFCHFLHTEDHSARSTSKVKIIHFADSHNFKDLFEDWGFVVRLGLQLG